MYLVHVTRVENTPAGQLKRTPPLPARHSRTLPPAAREKPLIDSPNTTKLASAEGLLVRRPLPATSAPAHPADPYLTLSQSVLSVAVFAFLFFMLTAIRSCELTPSVHPAPALVPSEGTSSVPDLGSKRTDALSRGRMAVDLTSTRATGSQRSFSITIAGCLPSSKSHSSPH